MSTNSAFPLDEFNAMFPVCMGNKDQLFMLLRQVNNAEQQAKLDRINIRRARAAVVAELEKVKQQEKQRHYELLFVDAWRDVDGGWTWNDSAVICDDFTLEDRDLTPRRVPFLLREKGYLTEESKGKIRVDFTEGMVEIVEKNTGEPLLALSEKD